MAAKGVEQEGKEFTSGVVEGFYGQPWTQGQRLDLFSRMKKLGLNTYMYAPKDDTKHRKHWRDKYVPAEQENLKVLIKSANENGIRFVYALSPGVDIIFSCPKDVQYLKRKMKQVAEMGCRCFALLFDDIEQELSLPDKEDFESFADAQVVITNLVHEHLGKPDLFLFCPTEYCTTRAKPSIKKSEYLKTLGKKLHGQIDILWTGPKVVSNEISISSLQTVTKVLKRKPIIWDNIHANDYDDRRVFLGPFDGRATEIYDHLNGILTNPNREYECNFVAIHTMGTWINCCTGNDFVSPKSPGEDSEKSDKEMEITEETDKGAEEVEMKPINEKIEGPTEQSIAEKEAMEPMDVAMDNDVSDQAGEMEAEEVIDDEAVSKLRLPPKEYSPNDALKRAVSAWLEEFYKEKGLKKGSLDISSSPSKLAISDDTNSLVDDVQKIDSFNKVKVQDEMKDSTSSDTDEASEGDSECCPHHSPDKKASHKKKPKSTNVTLSDLMLLADLFYLPYEYGEQAKHLVSEFKWLKTNAPPIHAAEKKSEKADEWKRRAADYHDNCQAVFDMFLHVSRAPNKPLVQELYPYIWDVKEVVTLLDAFIRWLGTKDRKCKEGTTLLPEDPEPWIFKGGIAEELERLLPLDEENTLLSNRKPSSIPATIYTIRPYLDSDKDAIYNLCLQTYFENEERKGGKFPNHCELAGDRFIGAYLKYSKAHTFIVEDDDGLCGYCVAAADAKEFSIKSTEWFKQISEKYERPTGQSENWNLEEKIIDYFHNPDYFIPEDLLSSFPAQIVINLLSRAKGTGIGKRLWACLMSVLKANDVKGVYCLLKSRDKATIDFHSNLGFNEMPNASEKAPDDSIVMVKNL